MFVAIRAAIYASAFVGFWTWLALSVRRLDPALGLTLPAWLRTPGIVIALVGVVLTVACVVVFVRRGRGTPAPFDPPREFVASGPYRWLRNPMYVGGGAVMLGCGFLLSSPAIVLLSLAFGLFFHVFVMLYEEPTLERSFGESYRAYRHGVRRWWISPPGDAVPGDPLSAGTLVAVALISVLLVAAVGWLAPIWIGTAG